MPVTCGKVRALSRMNVTTGLITVSLLFFLLDPLTSAFIRPDLRRQKANKETSGNVSTRKLTGLSSGSQALPRMWQSGWVEGAPRVDWLCGGYETSSTCKKPCFLSF